VRVGITGASGYLGTALTHDLRSHGHEVIRFVRAKPEQPDERGWDGKHLPPARLDGIDALVHLSGAGVGDKRWSPAYREQIRTSRVESTEAVARSVTHARTPVLLAGNAIGWYGDRGDTVLDETSGPGDTFLSQVCQEWQDATSHVDTEHTRLAVLRTGVVIGKDDALLRKQVPLFKAFLGAPLGPGTQYLSWIALSDWLAAARHLLVTDVEGPVNLTAPNPVTNLEQTKALGKALHRPTWPVHVPERVLRIAVGGLADEALGSARVLPKVLAASGFTWQHEHLPSALRAALG
jgi:uncharacterized protein (TIGR01777 family)